MNSSSGGIDSPYPRAMFQLTRLEAHNLYYAIKNTLKNMCLKSDWREIRATGQKIVACDA